MLVPTTLAVLGILSSCPRVMTTQCWKSKIPPPLSTRLRAVVVRWFFGFVLTKKKRNTTQQNSPEKIKLKDKRKTNTARLSQIPKIPIISKSLTKITKSQQNPRKSIKNTKKHKKCQKTYKVKGETT